MSNTYKFVNSDNTGNFASSANWLDETSPTIPGPPGSADTALVQTAGMITGSGDVGPLLLDGTGGTLTSTGQTITATALTLEGRVMLKGEDAYTIDGDVEQTGTSTVGMSGASNLYINTGAPLRRPHSTWACLLVMCQHSN